MKLSLNNIFDPDEVIKRFSEAKIQGLDDFIKSISYLGEKLTLALRSNISVSDNIDCIEKTLTLQHGKNLTIDNPDRLKQVRHIIVTKTSSFKNPVTSFAWTYNGQGSIDLNAEFRGTPTSAVIVTMILYF